MIWLETLPGILLTVALLALPGSAILWGPLRFSPPAALLYSPVVGAATIALGTVTLPLFGLRWSLPMVLVWMGLLSALSFAWGLWRERGRSGGAAEPERRPPSKVSQPLTWATLGFGAVGAAVFTISYAAAVLPAMGAPGAIPTLGDAQYHMQAVVLIQETGYAGPLNPFGIFYPDIPGGTAYPTLWHALVTPLTSLYPVVEATNIVALTVGLVLWPWAIVALTLTIRPAYKFAALAAPVLAIPFVVMPGVVLFSNAIFPLGIAAVMFTFALGLLGLLVRSPGIISALAFTLALIGTTAAHFTSGLLLGAALGIWVLVLIGAAVRQLVVTGRGAAGFALVALVVAVLGAALVMIPRLAMVQSLNARATEFVPTKRALGNFLLGQALTQTVSLVPLALYILAVAGVIFGIRSRVTLVLGLLSGFLFVMYVAAAGPDSYLRIFTSPWWKDSTRFIIVLIPLIVAFAAVALAYLVGALAKKTVDPARTTVWISAGFTAIFLVAGVLNTPFSLISVKQRYIVDSYLRDEDTTVALTEDELALLEYLDQNLPEGTVIVGDPDTGVAWAAIVSDLEQFQKLRMPEGNAQAFLGTHFDQIGEDPAVCQIIVDNNIEILVVSGEPSSQFTRYFTGYNQVDTTVGFELVHQVGEAEAYRITACG